MKLTALEVFHVKPHWMFLKVTTDAGITGWGEPGAAGQARMVAAVVDELRPALLGQDPGRIEHLWQTMYRGLHYRGGPLLMGAISGIEQALWDIKGKALNVPVYDLLGGSCRNRIRMIAPCGGTSPQDAAFQAKALRLRGYSAVLSGKDGLTHNLDSMGTVEKFVARVAAVRQEVGPTVDVAVDLHGRATLAVAKRLLSLLEPHMPLFVSEPCAPENVQALTQLTASSVVPLAVGGRLYSRWHFREILERQAAAVLQPSVSHVGGIFEARKIAAMAEVNHINIAPHSPTGPIALAASLQLAACTPNFSVQEHTGMSNKWDLGHGYLTTPFLVHEGYIDIPKGPGLGIEVNEDMLRERASTGEAEPPRMAQATDGSYTE